MRPYHISAKDADLCRRAGAEQSLFTEPSLGPWPHRHAKLVAIRKALIDIIWWQDWIKYGAMGYRIDKRSDIAKAKRMELAALQGKWLLEAEDDELDAMLLGPAVDAVLEFHGVTK